jgi:hypothetical protein
MNPYTTKQPLEASKMKTSNLMGYAASMTNPPKGYGSIESGLRVAAFRNKRLDHWAKEVGNGRYTEQVLANAQADVVAEFGEAF